MFKKNPNHYFQDSTLLCVFYVLCMWLFLLTINYLNLHMYIFKWRKSIFIPLVMVFFLFLSSYLLHIGIVPPLLLCKIAFNISFFDVKFIKFLYRFEKKGILNHRSASLNGQNYLKIHCTGKWPRTLEKTSDLTTPLRKYLEILTLWAGKISDKWEYKLQDVLHF